MADESKVYMERTPHVDDEVVLGTWITGGVVISTESFRRLTSLTGWMPVGDLAEIVLSLIHI